MLSSSRRQYDLVEVSIISRGGPWRALIQYSSTCVPYITKFSSYFKVHVGTADSNSGQFSPSFCLTSAHTATILWVAVFFSCMHTTTDLRSQSRFNFRFSLCRVGSLVHLDPFGMLCTRWIVCSSKLNAKVEYLTVSCTLQQSSPAQWLVIYVHQILFQSSFAAAVD